MKRTFSILLLIILCTYTQAMQGQLFASYTNTPSKGCPPLNVNFTNTSTGNHVKYLWDFGNGNTSIIKSPKALYTRPGVYNVTLTIWDANNKRSILTKQSVTVFKPPTASVSIDKKDVCIGDAVTYSDFSIKGDGKIVSWEWDLGDGTLKKGKKITHSYKSAKKYTLKQIIRDINGCKHTKLYADIVEAHNKPTSSFLIDKPFACNAPHTVKFSTLSSATKYEWDFGDGNKGNGTTATHTFLNKRTYTVRHTVTDKYGCFTSSAQYVKVQSIVANFNTARRKLCLGEISVFLNKTTPITNSMKFVWDFGDGHTSTNLNPSHIYSKPGIYTVSLRSTTPGCVGFESKKSFIEVLDVPKIDVFLSDSISCDTNKIFTFIDNSKNIRTRKWTYGNSNESGLQKISHNFKTGGIKKITLNVTDIYGCKNMVEKTIKIGDLKASYTQKLKDVTSTLIKPKKLIWKYGGCKELKLCLKNTSTHSFKLKSIFWKTDKAGSGNKETIELSYKDTGKDKGMLYVEDELGCKDSIPFFIEVGIKTKPWFSIDKEIICNNDTVAFKNLTIEPPNVDKWSWSLAGNEKNPRLPIRHEPDTLDITLTADINGCKSDTTRKEILIINAPYAKIKTNNTNCNLDTIFVANTSIQADSFVWKYANNKAFKNPKTSNDSILKFWPKDFSSYYFRLYTWNFKTGCTDTSIIEINSNYIDFNVNWPKVSGCAPIKTNFSISTSGLSEHKWVFNDQDSFYGQSINHTFTSAGKYLVKAVAIGNSCTYIKTKTYNIAGVKLSATLQQSRTCLPVELTLNDSLYDANDTLIKYWRIGSQTYFHTAKTTKFNLKEAPFSSDTAIHASLVYWDSISGCKSTKHFIIPVKGAKASINVKPFFNCSNILVDLSIVSYNNLSFETAFWKFSSGGTSRKNSTQASVKYNEDFKIELELTDSNGCVSTIYKTINYKNIGLQAMFKADTNGSFCPPLEVNFKDISLQGSSNIVKWEWDFGDGTKSNLKNPGKLYLLPGKYAVTLKVTDAKSCTSATKIPDFILVEGPTGVYSFDRTRACVPAEVNFKSTTYRTDEITWDFGDGVVVYGQNQTHTYDRPGRYIPFLFLADSFGCKYTLPVVDTIYVYDNPIADFKPLNPCFGDVVNFTNLSTSVDGTIDSNYWNFNDGFSSDSVHGQHLFTGSKNHMVELQVKTEHGCKDTIIKPIKLFEVQSEFNLLQKSYCIDELLRIKNISYGDTQLLNFTWDIGDSNIFHAKNINPNLTKRGKFDIQLIVEDVLGCKDTLVIPQAYFVGDTLPPPSPFIYRVNVVDNNSIDIKFAKSTIPDFKKYEVFRANNSGVYNKILEAINAIDTFQVDNSIITLHQSHCYKVSTENSCDKKLSTDVLLKHCSVELTAKTGINSVVLDWNHYIGWDSILYYDIYREDLNVKGKFDSIGQVSGDVNHYIDSSIFCDKILYYKVLAKQKKHHFPQQSFSDTSGAKPVYINTVPPNEIWRVSVENDSFVHMEWVPTKNTRFPIVYYSIYKGIPNNSYQQLTKRTLPNILKLDDKKVLVDLTDYNYKMYGVDQCGDRSEFSNISKTILLKTSTNIDQKPILEWTPYRGWEQGIEKYLVEFKNEDGTFSIIGETKPNVRTFVHNDVTFNCLPKYCYRVTAIRNQPDNFPDSSYHVISHSNESCAPVKSKLFVPNAFTVNNDIHNETFLVKGIYIKNYSIKIFTRWGEMIYSSDDCAKIPWNGFYKGKPAHQGVYVYIIQAIGVDGKMHNFKGDVTLLK